MAKRKMPKKLKTTKPRKRVHSAAELANDPSLRYCPYRKFELVWSDSHQTEMRFVEYVGDKIILATEAGMAVVDGLWDMLSIRRCTARPVEDRLWAGKYGGGPRPKGNK